MQELLSVSLMVSIKHKPIIDTQKIMRKESKHNATEKNHKDKWSLVSCSPIGRKESDTTE